MAAVVGKTMEAGDAVQWLSTQASYDEIVTLIGVRRIRRKSLIRSNWGLEIESGGVFHDVNDRDYVFVGETSDFAVLTPAEFARYYEAAP